MRKIFTLLVLLTAVNPVKTYAEDPGQDIPWWKQQKIRFMWGQWSQARHENATQEDVELLNRPYLRRKLFRDVARAGGTVFVEHEGYRPNHARYARQFGLKYFATRYVASMTRLPGQRKAIKKTGEPGHWKSPWCPLDQRVYDKWLVEPHLDGVREGLIDGIHVDWERYGGFGEAGICYCDDCFATFLSRQDIQVAIPDKADRFPWLEDRDRVDDYEENFHRRRVEMFTRIRETLQAVNPRLLFSSYNKLVSDFTEAVHTSQAPFIVADARHYQNDDRQPWWESPAEWLRGHGYLYLPGGWTNAIFGAQASQVSAAQWIYEASINHDGCWVWFERELDDEILRAYATADREIQAVLNKVGKFLFHGKRDAGFATAVEWTGRPQLERAVIHRTYHLDGAHLVHVNNVDTEWPLRVRLRFPRLREASQWTVHDVMDDLYYMRDDASPEWTSDDLLAGVVVTLEPRSNLFLVLSRSDVPDVASTPRPSALIHSREFDRLPEDKSDFAKAGPVKAIVDLYRMKNAIYGESLQDLLTVTNKVFDLPKSGWYFKMDQNDVGAGLRWFRRDTPLDDWDPIDIEDFWGAAGGTGPGWYRREIDVPQLPEGHRVYLHFGAVDEWLVLWIGGQYAGDYDRDPQVGWDKPFAIDVTGKFTSGGKHHLALRVANSDRAGGVWKPVSVLTGPAIEGVVDTDSGEAVAEGPAGRLVYTATEPMGLRGAEGPLTIANTIRTVNGNGANHLRVRQARGHFWSPSYSPDGKRIAFNHEKGGRGQIFVMDEDGSNAINISNNAFCNRSPVWSPGGDMIAFMSDRTGDWDIYVMHADGTVQRRLAGNPGLDRAPAWSPDGGRIAWESHVTATPDIWVCDVDGRNSHPVIDPEKTMVVERAESEWGKIMPVKPMPDLPGNEFYLTSPVWSPDGRRIAAVGPWLLSSAHMVFVLEADGSRLLQLIVWLPGAANLSWSPDGTRLAGTWRTAPAETERSGIFVVKADGTDDNPFGRWLVDVTPVGPRLGGARRRGLLTSYSHGSARPRRVVKTFTSPSWSPDSNTLAFSSDMDRSGAFFVYTISPDGGEPQRIRGTKSAWPQEIMWRPQGSSLKTKVKTHLP